MMYQLRPSQENRDHINYFNREFNTGNWLNWHSRAERVSEVAQSYKYQGTWTSLECAPQLLLLRSLEKRPQELGLRPLSEVGP